MCCAELDLIFVRYYILHCLDLFGTVCLVGTFGTFGIATPQVLTWLCWMRKGVHARRLSTIHILVGVGLQAGDTVDHVDLESK